MYDDILTVSTNFGMLLLYVRWHPDCKHQLDMLLLCNIYKDFNSDLFMVFFVARVCSVSQASLDDRVFKVIL